MLPYPWDGVNQNQNFFNYFFCLSLEIFKRGGSKKQVDLEKTCIKHIDIFLQGDNLCDCQVVLSLPALSVN